MQWSEFSDTLLVREIVVIEPYRFTPKSNERGQAWTEVARNVTKAYVDTLCSVPEISWGEI